MCEVSQPTGASYLTGRRRKSLECREMLPIGDRIGERRYMQNAAANRELRLLQTIGRAPDTQRAPIQGGRVNHGRTDVRMAE